MAIIQRLKKPDLFVTFTCNPKWDEITNNLFKNQTAYDRPDIVAGVFKLKYFGVFEITLDECEKTHKYLRLPCCKYGSKLNLIDIN